MSIDAQIIKASERAKAQMQRQANIMMREAHENVRIYWSDFLHPATEKNYRISKGKLTKGQRIPLANTTKKLYTLYGNLQRALTPKQKGSISKIEEGKDDITTTTIGIDTSVEVNAGKYTPTLIYAEAHEETRPYFLPGIEAYIAEAQPGYLKDIIADAVQAWDTK